MNINTSLNLAFYRSVSNPGKLSGLTLDLNAEVEEYTPLASSLGIKVLLHDPRTMPFPQDAGFTATTGQVTSIGFTEVRNSVGLLQL